jgi:hypothetical protein
MRWRSLSLCIAVFLSIDAAVEAAQAARPFHYSYKSKHAEFDFSWSSEAAAVPALAKRLHAQLTKEKAATLSGGKEEYVMRRKMGFFDVGWTSSTKITTSGQTPRLLSLSRKHWTFTGGAHGNGATSGLLWDRSLSREISFADLFPDSAGYTRVLRAPYCAALDRERRKRRGGDGKAGGMFPEFDSCPKFAKLAFIPADAHHRGKFDQIHLIAAPYEAGPFSEGQYDIALPITRALIAEMKPAYRSSFEAQRQ